MLDAMAEEMAVEPNPYREALVQFACVADTDAEAEQLYDDRAAREARCAALPRRMPAGAGGDAHAASDPDAAIAAGVAARAVAGLHGVKVPTLLVWGPRGSPRRSRVRRGVRAADRGYARVEIIEDCGHLPQVEQPERTLALVHEFLDAS